MTKSTTDFSPDKMISNCQLTDLIMSFTSYRRFLKRKPYEVFSRGEINVKGLGLKRTYFVEPASDSESTTKIFVDSQDSDSETNSLNDEVDNRKDAFMRSPSFVKYHHIRPVTPVQSVISMVPQSIETPFRSSSSSLNELSVSPPRPRTSVNNLMRPTLRGAELAPTPSGVVRHSRISTISNTSIFTRPTPDFQLGSPQHVACGMSVSQPDLRVREQSGTTKGKKAKSKSKSKRRYKGCRVS